MYLFDLLSQETVEDLWCLIIHCITEKLKSEESRPEGLLDMHFGRVVADSGQPADGNNRLMTAFELRLPYSSDINIDLGKTIEEAGLTPSAVIIFQRRRNTQRQVHADRSTNGSL